MIAARMSEEGLHTNVAVSRRGSLVAIAVKDQCLYGSSDWRKEKHLQASVVEIQYLTLKEGIYK